MAEAAQRSSGRFYYSAPRLTFRLRPNLCRSAVPVRQRPDVSSWSDLPFDTSPVNSRNVPMTVDH